MNPERHSLSLCDVLFVFLSCVVIGAVIWLDFNFGIVSVESILFTLLHPIGGAPFYFYKTAAIAGLLVITGTGAVLFCLSRLHARHNGSLVPTLLRRAPVLLCAGALVFAAVKTRLYEYLYYTARTSTFIEQEYHSAESGRFAAPTKKNVIVLLMESMENTFHEGEHNLIPNLKALQDEHVTFYTYHPVEGTTFTTGGMTAYFFGLPLIIPVDDHNAMHNFASFLPSADSILTVLDKAGYAINLIMNCVSEYGGVNTMFTTHVKNPAIYDMHYLSTLPDAENNMGMWGYRDAFQYAAAKQLLTESAAKQTPFFTVIVTLDTHTPAIAFGDYDQPFGDERDAFIAADAMAAEFVTWLKAQDFYDDTVLIILGDHAYMSESLGAMQLPEQRTVYNCFINTGKEPLPMYRQKKFLPMDIAPTILECAGFEWESRAFGLGVSLFSEKPTLVEKYGYENVKEQLRMRSELYRSFFR